MLMESWAIIVLLLMMAGIFSHRKKMNYAVMTLPLGIVPFSRVCSGPLASAVRGLGVSLSEVRRDRGWPCCGVRSVLGVFQKGVHAALQKGICHCVQRLFRVPCAGLYGGRAHPLRGPSPSLYPCF